MSKQVAWSHSALNTYRTCPKKYWHEKIKKDVPFTESDASRYGKEVHKAFEDYIDKNKKLPFGLKQYGPYLDKFKNAKGQKLVEQKIAITREFAPTGYFDNDVWFRGQADLIILNDNHAVVVDWKTGKMKNDFDQLDLMAAGVFCLDPDIQTIDALFWWTQGREHTMKSYTRDDAREIFNRFIPLVQRLENAVAHTDFPPTTNGLCKKWCAVNSCPYKGV